MRASYLSLAVASICLGFPREAVSADAPHPFGQVGAAPGTAPLRDPGSEAPKPSASFYVSPTGSDDNGGTLGKPFRTLARARDAVRERRRHGTPITTVLLRAGTYYLEEPVWFKDDPRKREASCLAVLRGPAAIEEGVVALGVDGAVSKDHYVVQTWRDRLSATAIPRKAGWHKLVFDVKPGRGEGAELSLDGLVVGRVPMFPAFTTIDLGDSQFGTDSIGLGFDSVAIE